MERIYSVKNMLSNRNANGGLYLFATEVQASVELAEAISKSTSIRLEEVQLWEIGTYDEEANIIQAYPVPKLIAWDMRRIREQKMADMTPREVENDLSKL